MSSRLIRASSSGGGTPAGSSGEVQYNNAGAFGSITVGTVGQVLTSNGAGVPASMQDAAGNNPLMIQVFS